MNLEAKLENSKSALSGTLEAPDTMKSIQQGDSTLDSKKGLFSTANRIKVDQLEKMDSNILSEASETSSLASERIGQGDSNFKQNKTENESNFVTLHQISEEERVEIIQKGFQLNQERKISLKKYYESTQEFSLFQSKGYQIKYDTIRKNHLYQQLKDK